MYDSYISNFTLKTGETTQVEMLDFERKTSLYKAVHKDTFYLFPFGVPRTGMNIDDIDHLSEVPVVNAAMRKICDLFASAEEEITGGSDENQNRLNALFDNPNMGGTSWEDEKYAWCYDVLKFNNGVIQKIFNKKLEFVEMRSIDSSSILINFDRYGMLGSREDLIPTDLWAEAVKGGEKAYYGFMKNQPAYFQYYYGIPIPFGRRELMFTWRYRDNRSVYGESPIEILYNILQIIRYGTKYHLDYYVRDAMPRHGYLAIKGATEKVVKQLRELSNNELTYYDQVEDMRLKEHFKIPMIGVGEKGGFDFVTPRVSNKDMEVLASLEHFEELVWICLGVNANEMGRTDAVNKATGMVQEDIVMKSCVIPLHRRFAYAFNRGVCLTEFNDPELKISYPYVDLEHELKKQEVYEKKLSNKLTSVNLILESEGEEPWSDGKYDLPTESSFGGFGFQNQGEDREEFDEVYEGKSVELSDALTKIINKEI